MTPPDAGSDLDVDAGAPDRDEDADGGDRFPADPTRAATLREIAEDVRGESSESEQVAAMLYRVSDLYDPDEETTPEDIYRNVRNIVNVKQSGGLRR